MDCSFLLRRFQTMGLIPDNYLQNTYRHDIINSYLGVHERRHNIKWIKKILKLHMINIWEQ